MADLTLDDVSKLKGSQDDVVVRAALAYENLCGQIKLIRAEADTAAVNAGTERARRFPAHFQQPCVQLHVSIADALLKTDAKRLAMANARFPVVAEQQFHQLEQRHVTSTKECEALREQSEKLVAERDELSKHRASTHFDFLDPYL